MSLTLTHPPTDTLPLTRPPTDTLPLTDTLPPIDNLSSPSSLVDDRTLELAPALDPLSDSAAITETDEERGTSYARCSDGNGTLAYLFFSDDDHELARAKAICRPCGLKETCLSGALEREEPYGVWGGLLVLDGVPVEVKRKRGRPPKHPKPVLVVEEVPIPEHLVA